MDLTPPTDALIRAIQVLKSRHPEDISHLFLDFCGPCRQGGGYLSSPGTQESVRLLDILQELMKSIGERHPTPLMRLMWKDGVEPRLGECLGDETTEARLEAAFQSMLPALIKTWDRAAWPSGSGRLVLQDLLADLWNLEAGRLRATP